MASLIKSNKYLKNVEMRKKMLWESALQSSIFEGASHLKKLLGQQPGQFKWNHNYSKRSVTAAVKKSAKGK